jgi:hypothetical protein
MTAVAAIAVALAFPRMYPGSSVGSAASLGGAGEDGVVAGGGWVAVPLGADPEPPPQALSKVMTSESASESRGLRAINA